MLTATARFTFTKGKAEGVPLRDEDRGEDIEEERCVLYIAMTGARDQLHLVHPHRFYASGQPALGARYVHAPRSRFIPDALLRLSITGYPALPIAQRATAPQGLACPRSTSAPRPSTHGAGSSDLIAPLRAWTTTVR